MTLGWFSRAAETVLIDEGGVRCTYDGTMRYVALATLVDAQLLTPALTKPTLWMVTAEGARFLSAIPAHVPIDGLVGALLGRCDAARATKAARAALRGDLGAWIAKVAASLGAVRGEAYRASAVDLDELEQVFADVTDENEARAAAAHALLAAGRHTFVGARVGPLTPPLVLAAVRLASGGESIATQALLESALPFLELRDRVVFTQRLRGG